MAHPPAVPHPAAISCSNPPYPEYTWVYPSTLDYVLGPPMPWFGNQAPCTVIDPTTPSPGAFHDEVHETFTSSVPGSGARAQFPIHLPPTGASVSPATVLGNYYVGMVVHGDVLSPWNESYAEIYFAPNVTANHYDVVASVWTLHVNLSTNTGCNGLSFTWNGSYACESQMLGGGLGSLLTTGVAGGDWVNITFVGKARSTQPLTIYVNDTARTIADAVTLNSATTGGSVLSPEFSAACADSCFLNWSGRFGLGFGADLCDYAALAACNSYNETAFNDTLPLTVDPPKFFNSSSVYGGDYRLIGLSSLSGACGGQGPSYNTVSCPLPDASTGFYPVFTFNGSELNLGTQKPWVTENWGGALQEYSTVGGTVFQVPFFLRQLANDSRAGFIAPTSSLNVTVRAQVLGEVSGVRLNYTLPDRVGGNVSMTLLNGSSRNGYYIAAIPATGGNGRIPYRVWGTDSAGAVLADPVSYEPAKFVQREKIPTFTVGVRINAASCGHVTINGSNYGNGSSVSLEAGFYPLVGHPCYPWVFGSWAPTAGLSVSGGITGTLTVSANGTLWAFWSYVRPLDSITLAYSPASCGTIFVNGSSYSAPTSLALWDWFNYSLSQSPCGLYSFAGWTVTNSTNISILGGTLTPHGNGTLTANYIPTSQALSVVFQTVPASCGGIQFRGAGYTNNMSVSVLASTPYPIHQLPCAHYGFSSFTTAGGVSVSAGELTATTGGIVTEVNYHLTEVTIQSLPSFCGEVVWDGVPYPNGTVLNVTNNTVHTVSAVACPGYYFVGFFASGGVHVSGNVVTVNGSGVLQANFQRGTPSLWVGFQTAPGSCGAIVFGGVRYVNSNYTHVGPFAVVTVVALPCAGYGFVGWATSGGVTIVGSTAYVNSSGSIRAIFHPLALLYLQSSPASCGTIFVGGVAHVNGDQVELPVNFAVPIAASPCAGYRFSLWQNTSDAFLDHGFLTITATAILKAVFVLQKYPVTFLVSPATCGGVQFGPREFFNNSTVALTQGVYAIALKPCPGNYATGVNASGNISANATTLSVLGSGVLSVNFGPVPPTLRLEGPASSYTDSPILFLASVGVPVPPYEYNYTWEFGDGSTASSSGNFTTHTYAHPGTYTVHVTVLDPFGRTARASLTVVVTSQPALAAFSLTPLDYGLVAAVILVVLLFLLLARRRPGRPAGGAGAPPAPAASPPNPQERPPLTFDAPSEEPSNPEETV